ncbi:MAG TPA: YkgJ family cysteine cluster protein [Blastocatellia bacterium]|nr:YkgJ family cysteine cluster protein [Blastocatellia bacterium]
MKRKELPVLGLPFRRYPTRLDQQCYDDEHQVCRDCLSGACCESEGPIYLTSLDVFRLAAFFNLAPAEFLLTFTQERFNDDPYAEARRRLIDDAGCSIITYLRRRENFSASPCIFLKYVRESDGTPRRICSVYDARPLACREFYFDTCKKRVTGEMAVLLAEGYEKIGNREITEPRVDDELSQVVDSETSEPTLATTMKRWFWGEMRRALNLEPANIEGSNSYEIVEFQDPIDAKLNRVLSSKYVRFEEKYGQRPRGEQLTPYAAGLSFANSAERERITRIVSSAPESHLYDSGGMELTVGVRTLIAGAKHARVFETIPDSEVGRFLAEIPARRLFPDHYAREVRAITLRDIYAAVLKGCNHLIRFVSYLAAMGDVLEDVAPCDFESELLEMIGGFQTSLNPFIARNPYLAAAALNMLEAVLRMLEREIARPLPSSELFKLLRILSRIRPAVTLFGPELRARFASVTREVDGRLQKDRLETYVIMQNPVELRWRSGKRLNSRVAWERLSEQILDMRTAADAGFAGIDLDDFFQRSVAVLVKIPFRESYIRDLCGVVINLVNAMSSRHAIAYRDMSCQNAARLLSEYSVRLMDWIEDSGVAEHELVSELASAVYKGLGLGYNHDRHFGLTVRQVLDTQLPDGSWNTDPVPEDLPDCQADYLRSMYRGTWVCMDVLRPLKTDVLNPANVALGLA